MLGHGILPPVATDTPVSRHDARVPTMPTQGWVPSTAFRRWAPSEAGSDPPDSGAGDEGPWGRHAKLDGEAGDFVKRACGGAIAHYRSLSNSRSERTVFCERGSRVLPRCAVPAYALNAAIDGQEPRKAGPFVKWAGGKTSLLAELHK